MSTSVVSFNSQAIGTSFLCNGLYSLWFFFFGIIKAVQLQVKPNSKYKALWAVEKIL